MLERLITETPATTWETPGLVVHRRTTTRGLRGEEPGGQVLVLDLDATATDTNPHMEMRVLPWLDTFARTLGVRTDLVRQPTRDFMAREEVHNLEFLIIELALLMGVRWPLTPDATQTELIEPYLEQCLELERQIAAFEGVAEGLAEVRRRWPQALVVLNTNCPTWLAMMRCHLIGILSMFDGVIGVEPHPPDIQSDHPFWQCLQHCQEWIAARIAAVPHSHLQLVCSVPWWRAKPDPLGLALALSWADPESKLRCVSCGDNPGSEGRMAYDLNAGVRKSNKVRFVQARYGWPDAKVERMPIDATIDSFPALVAVLEQMWK